MATDPADVPATARAMNAAVAPLDFSCPDGAQIPIEERAAEELGAGTTVVANPAFDVTPAKLIAGIVTERGIIAPSNLGAVKP